MPTTCAIINPDRSIAAVIVAQITDPPPDAPLIMVAVPDELTGTINHDTHDFDLGQGVFVEKGAKKKTVF